MAGNEVTSASAAPIGTSSEGSLWKLLLAGLLWAGWLIFLVFLLFSRTSTS